MKFTLLALLFYVMNATSPFYAYASDRVEISTESDEKLIKGSAFIPLNLQVGLDAGVFNHTTTIPKEGPFSGYSIAGKGLASLEFENWIIESGLGWHYSALYGTTRDLNPPFTEIGHRVYTQSAFVEAGIRLKLHQRFNIGLIAQDYFGADLSLSQRRGTNDHMLLGGAAASVDFLGESGVFRLGAQLLGEILDNQRQVIYYGATLQFGIPLVGSDTLLRKEKTIIKRERTETVTVPKVVTKTIIKDVSKYSVPARAFRFFKGQGSLSLNDQKLASELGQLLKRFSPSFKQVTIEATVKKTQSPRRDLELSQARADSIKNAIVSLGLLTTAQVKSRGMGGRSNLNERGLGRFSLTLIDLSFTDLVNEPLIIDALTQFFNGRKTPATCRGGQCK